MSSSGVVRSSIVAIATLLLSGAGLVGASGAAGSVGWAVVEAAPTAVNLDSVAALARDDVWAAGWRYDFTRGVYRPATEHWNGQRWRFLSAPSASPGYNAFNAVAGSSASDVWAVGYSTPRYQNYLQAPLIEHWNGSAWQVIPGADVGGGVLSGVAAISANDVWAVGTSHAGNVYGALSEHWDGSSWQAVDNPYASRGQLFAVAARSASDVWAFGETAADNGNIETLVLHWDGASWQRVATTDTPLKYHSLQAGALDPAGGAWGVGWQSRDVGYTALAERINESGGTPTRTPTGESFLHGVAVTTTGDAWAVGYGTGPKPLFERWDGSRWRAISVPAAGSNGEITAIASVGKTLWAVGYSNTQQGGALILRRN